jgi:hypothetical protein
MNGAGIMDMLRGGGSPGMGGSQGGLDPRAGGSPGMTIHMRKLYDEYNMSTQATGETPLEWEEWLMSQGYELGPDMQVRQSPTGSPLGGRPLGGPLGF